MITLIQKSIILLLLTVILLSANNIFFSYRLSQNFYTNIENTFDNAINYVEDRQVFFNNNIYSWKNNSNVATLSSFKENTYNYNRVYNISAIRNSINTFKSSIPELLDIFIFFKSNNIVISSGGSWSTDSANTYLSSMNIDSQSFNDNVMMYNNPIAIHSNSNNVIYSYISNNFKVVYIINKKVVNQMLSRLISPDYAIFSVMDNETNILQSNINNEKIISFKKSYNLSKKTDFNYSLKYNMAKYYKQLIITNTIGMIICLFLLLFIVVTFVLLKKDLYNPMQNILKKIPSLNNYQDFTEFEIIEHSLESLNGKVFEYQLEWNKISKSLEQIAINEILYSTPSDCKSTLTLNQNISNNYYCILSIVMEDLKGENNFDSLNNFNKLIEDSYKFTHLFSSTKINTYIFFFPHDNNDYNNFIIFIKNFIKLQKNCFCIGGISNLFIGQEYMKTAFSQSQKSLNSVSTDGLIIDDFLCVYNSNFENEKKFSISIEYFNKLVNSILSSDIQNVSAIITDIMNANRYLNIFQKRKLLLYLYETLCLIISKHSTYDKTLYDKNHKAFDLANGVYNVEVFYSMISNFYQTIIGTLVSEKNDILKVIVDYINSNLSKNISLQQLADEMGFSYSYMGQYFKNKTGMNFIDFLQEKRITKSAELLISTDLDILEIACQTGFNTLNTFFRTFKKFKGITPGEYRKQNTNNSL